MKNNKLLYLLPKGRRGFYWEPEIAEVLAKYGAMDVDISLDTVQASMTKEIGDRIREIPLHPVEIDEPPESHFKYLSNDFMRFADGSTTAGLKVERKE